MIRLPPRSPRTDTLYPYTTLLRAGDDVPLRSDIDGGLHGRFECGLIADGMIGRHQEDQRVRTELLGDEMCGARGGRCGIAAFRLQQHGSVADPRLTQLFADQETIRDRTEDNRAESTSEP